MIVGKAVNLAHDMKVDVLALVENMAYFECDDCGKKHYIFGEPEVQTLQSATTYLHMQPCPWIPIATLVDAGEVQRDHVKDALKPVDVL